MSVIEQIATPFIDVVARKLRHEISQPTQDFTYSSGLAGKLLAHVCLNEPGEDHELAVIEDGIVACLAALPKMPSGLFQGSSGMLFACLELDRYFNFGLAQDAAYDYDEYLRDCLKFNQNLPYHFDLISGIAGLTVYANYRAITTGNNELLHLCVDRLEKMSTQKDGLCHWFTPPEWIRGFPMGNSNPMGCIDLGMAHGQPGVYAALAYAYASAQDTRDKTRHMLSAGLKELALYELQDGHGHFGTAANSDRLSRCAWCYGDLGAISALRLAAYALKQTDYDQWAERILQTMAQRPIDDLAFHDAWMCHGSLGSAWILQQLQCPSHQFLEHIHALHDRDGPFSVLYSAEHDAGVETGILEGLAGAALALAELNGRQLPLHWSLPFLAGLKSVNFNFSQVSQLAMSW